jgi:hypothetical protein
MIQSKRMRQETCKTQAKIRNECKILVGNREARDNLEEMGVDERVLIN